MSDVRQMLGVAPSGAGSSTGAPVSRAKRTKPAVGDKGFTMLSPDSLPSIMPTAKRSLKPRRGKPSGWAMVPFVNSGRRDGVKLQHWARKDVEYGDYAFARFNKKVEIVRYTDEEYRRYLAGEASPALTLGRGPQALRSGGQRWSKEETDALFDLCRRFDLRWSVIVDRYDIIPHRTIEELKDRFYNVTRKVIAVRCRDRRLATQIASSGLRQYAQFHFNGQHEHVRRHLLEQQFLARTSTAAQEAQARQQLKRLDAAIKKVSKKLEKSPSFDTKVAQAATEIEDDPVVEQLATTKPQDMPYATPACPAGASWRSALLTTPVMTPCVSNRAHKKVAGVLTELGIPAKPMATARVVEEHARLRQEVLLMLSLHKLVRKRQRQATGLLDQRSKLAITGPQPVLHAMTNSRIAAQQAATERAKLAAQRLAAQAKAKHAAAAAVAQAQAATAMQQRPQPAATTTKTTSKSRSKASRASQSAKAKAAQARVAAARVAQQNLRAKNAALAAQGGGKGLVPSARGVTAVGMGKGKGTLPGPRKRRITIAGRGNTKRARKS